VGGRGQLSRVRVTAACSRTSSANASATSLRRSASAATASASGSSSLGSDVCVVEGTVLVEVHCVLIAGVLVDILGVCGVLGTPDHRGYAESYVPADRRELPSRHYVDRAFPACWWTGVHGVNDDNLALFLPQLGA
jgi:hypothetical protein